MIVIKKIEAADLAQRLRNGQVLAMPTETAYGLIADSANKKAIDRIYRIKERPSDKPLPVVCSSLYQVRKFFFLSSAEESLAKRYWPGPLSVRLNIKAAQLRHIDKKQGTAVARVTSYPLLRRLARMMRRPLVATSANISGKGECYDARSLADQFRPRTYRPDVIIDQGRIKKVKPSTIVEVGDDGKVIVMRQGSVFLRDGQDE